MTSQKTPDPTRSARSEVRHRAYPFPQLLGFDEFGFGGRPEPVPLVPVLLVALAAGAASVLTVLWTGSRSIR